MKYLDQREKIIQAYYKDKLEPYDTCACFIGNLLNNIGNWSFCREKDYKNSSSNLYPMGDYYKRLGLNTLKIESNNFYSPKDITTLEDNFLEIINENTINSNCPDASDNQGFLRKIHPNYEEALFLAMDSTLDLLYEIHLKNGDESLKEQEKPLFVKRELKPQVC